MPSHALSAIVREHPRIVEYHRWIGSAPTGDGPVNLC